MARITRPALRITSDGASQFRPAEQLEPVKPPRRARRRRWRSTVEQRLEALEHPDEG